MNLKNLASSLITKLIIGFTLAATVVISIVYFLQVFHVYLMQFTNGAAIEMSTYAVILLGSLTGIYFLISDRPEKKVDEPSRPASMDVESLSLTFLEGFLNGMSKRANRDSTF